jgi:hypothetical protein
MITCSACNGSGVEYLQPRLIPFWVAVAYRDRAALPLVIARACPACSGRKQVTAGQLASTAAR